MNLSIEPQEKEILQSVKIPPRPKALLAVMEESKKPEPSFPVISKAIIEDISISASVLQVVNSPAFRRASAVTSIEQALSLLGLKRVISIVNAVSVRNATNSDTNMEEFWECATLVANASVIASNKLQFKAIADDAYTLGLFHNAGVPIMIAKFPDYEAFYQAAEIEGWTFNISKEKEKYGTTHTTIGALMAQEWTLPMELVDVIYNLHYAEGLLGGSELSEKSQQLLAILKMAREITRFYQGAVEASNEWLQVEGQVIEFCGMDNSQFDVFKEQVVNDLEG